MSRVEIVLAALHIKVERVRGRRGWARCPYHRDDTPTNFFIRLSGERAGQTHCFSCKNGGTLADLVMHVRSCDYATARSFIENLGKGYEPPRARARVVARPPSLGRTRFKLPTDIYFEPMNQWVSGARKYATNRCKITPEEVTKYGIGYAVDGILAGRIVIPWRGAKDIVGGYSARTFVDEEPKYKTPHESDNPDNSIMFGEHTWSMKRETLVVTEGALNAMAVFRALSRRFEFDIAAMGGSEIFPAQVIKMATFKRVIVMTDSDPAGDKCAPTLIGMLGRYTKTLRTSPPRKKPCKKPGEWGRFPDTKDALDMGPEYLCKLLVSVFADFGVTRVFSAS